MLQPKHTGSFDTNSFPLNVALGNIWNNSGVKEIVGRNPSVPKSEETEASYFRPISSCEN